MTRDHRLRERRLKLGVTQYLVGVLAGFTTGTAAPYVGRVERRVSGWAPAHHLDAVRRAIVYLEMQPRCRRKEDRKDRALASQVDAALADGRSPANDLIVVNRLVGLLRDGRCEDFDALALHVSLDLVKLAGDQYLDEGDAP